MGMFDSIKSELLDEQSDMMSSYGFVEPDTLLEDGGDVYDIQAEANRVNDDDDDDDSFNIAPMGSVGFEDIDDDDFDDEDIEDDMDDEEIIDDDEEDEMEDEDAEEVMMDESKNILNDILDESMDDIVLQSVYNEEEEIEDMLEEACDSIKEDDDLMDEDDDELEEDEDLDEEFIF